MFESVIGSLIAAAIGKITKEAAERFSKLRQRTEGVKDEHERKELQKEIDESTRELEKLKEDLATRTMKALYEPLKKMFPLNQIRAVLERAHAICKKGATAEDIQNINLELGSFYIREAISGLSQPLEWKPTRKRGKELKKDIKELIRRILYIYKTFQGNWNCGLIGEFLALCHELEGKFAEIMREGI